MSLYDGSRPGPGRPKGSLNRWSKSSLDAVLAVFEQLGGIDAMTQWAREHQTAFYRGIYSRLLPTRAQVEVSIDAPRSVDELTDAELEAIIQDARTRRASGSTLTLEAPGVCEPQELPIVGQGR